MEGLTRKQFLKVSGISMAASILPSFSYEAPKSEENPAIGLCGSWNKSSMAKEAGCDYMEAGVANLLMPDKPEAEFKKQFEALLATQPLSVECFNAFLPKELKSVGVDANHEGIVNYGSVAFQRAEIVRARIIVFGSGVSRTIPDGFDKATAKEQFIALCKRLAPIAEKYKITLAIEQLNKEETNFINTLQESAEIVDAVNHPNLKMMCDIYHALKENEPAHELTRHREHIVHCHIAEKKDRRAPSVNGEDFTSYFSALKKINYKGRISLECNWKDQDKELPMAVKIVSEQWENA